MSCACMVQGETLPCMYGLQGVNLTGLTFPLFKVGTVVRNTVNGLFAPKMELMKLSHAS